MNQHGHSSSRRGHPSPLGPAKTTHMHVRRRQQLGYPTTFWSFPSFFRVIVVVMYASSTSALRRKSAAFVFPGARGYIPRLRSHSSLLFNERRFFSTSVSAAATVKDSPGSNSKKTGYYVTTPIYYVNDKPHIGHAYTTLACDVIARFMRLDGRDVFFLTGTDEHGQKVEQSAAKAGKSPQTFVDEVSQNFRSLAKIMEFTNDKFIRTTQADHKAAVQALWKQLEAAGHIYLGAYEGWYSVRDEAYYTESELVDGKAPTGAEVVWVVKEPSYFFKLSAWQEPLLEFYAAHPNFIAPESRRNEVISFVKGGLKDLSISRTTFKWGVPVPEDDDHVMYVWMDALTNYISALGYPEAKGSSPTPYQRFWPADLHVVGKDILRFHAVYWPAFLMAAGLAPPRRIFAHGWWTKDRQKISKSLGNVIDPLRLVEQFGLDPTRYFLMSEVPFGNDGDFSNDAFVRRVNNQLANELGNLFQRSLAFIAKNCEGQVPEPTSALTEADVAMLRSARGLLETVRPLVRDEQALHRYSEALNRVVNEGNRYFDEQAPWTLRKTDKDRMATVLYVTVEALRSVALLYQPLIPASASKLLDLLAVPSERRMFADVGADAALTPGTPLPKPEGVFPRVEDPDAPKDGAASPAKQKQHKKTKAP